MISYFLSSFLPGSNEWLLSLLTDGWLARSPQLSLSSLAQLGLTNVYYFSERLSLRLKQVGRVELNHELLERHSCEIL